MRYCFVKQDGLKDCGVACLLMIIRTYKGNAPKEYLREITHTTKDGTTAYDLMKAAEKFHFTSFGLRGKVEDLRDEYFPVIAHVIKDGVYQHFIVIYQYDLRKQKLTIADPAVGIRKISLEEFRKISSEQFIIFIQNTSILKIYSKHPIYAVLKKFLKQNKRDITFVLVFSFLYTILGILLTFCFQTFVDYVLLFNQFTLLIFTGFIFLMMALLKSIFQYIRFSYLIRFTHNFDKYLFQNVYHRLFLLPDSYYQNRTTGELLARITDLVDFKNTISKFLLDVFIDSVLAVLSLLILFLLNFKLTCLLLLFVGFDFLLFFMFRHKMVIHANVVKESYAKFHSYLVDTISSVFTIRHIACEEYIEDGFVRQHEEELKESIRYQKCWNRQLFFKNLIHGTSTIFLIAFGCYMIMQGGMTTTSLMSYLFLSSFFLSPIESIYEFLLDFQDGKESFKRIEEFYQVEEEEEIHSIGVSHISDIIIRDLSYFYRRGEQVLDRLSISFQKGSKVLVYGKSGCGKSTLIKILAGYLNDYEGEILVNGQVIAKNDKQFFRNHITYVSQDETLLNRSLRENIIMGRDISENVFLEVCQMLKIDDFVSKNVLTYDMPIEENGANLSGGEKQRIILARSILKEGDVYIFDESLCNMDVSLEREVLINLFQYLKNKTIIVVSHRFYNADLYDEKVELQKGGIIHGENIYAGC